MPPSPPMRRFRLLAEAAGATEFLACATSALRTASNGDEVLDRIATEAGVDADVIDGLEEARLIFTAIRAAVHDRPAPAVCFDLGGGSLEIMVGDVSGLAWAASERLGVGPAERRVRPLGPARQGRPAPAPPAHHRRAGTSCGRGRDLRTEDGDRQQRDIEDLGHMIAARRDESMSPHLPPPRLLAHGARCAAGRPRHLHQRATPQDRGTRRQARRPHRRRRRDHEHRDGAFEVERAHRQRMGAARGHGARRDRPPRSRRLVRRPLRDPARVGDRAGAPLLVAGGALPPRRDALARALRPAPRAARPRRRGPRAPRVRRACSTTSASTSPTRATTAMPRTS